MRLGEGWLSRIYLVVIYVAKSRWGALFLFASCFLAACLSSMFIFNFEHMIQISTYIYSPPAPSPSLPPPPSNSTKQKSTIHKFMHREETFWRTSSQKTNTCKYQLTLWEGGLRSQSHFWTFCCPQGCPGTLTTAWPQRDIDTKWLQLLRATIYCTDVAPLSEIRSCWWRWCVTDR